MKVHVETLIGMHLAGSVDSPEMMEEMGLLCTMRAPAWGANYAVKPDLSDVTCKRCLLKVWGKTLAPPTDVSEEST